MGQHGKGQSHKVSTNCTLYSYDRNPGTSVIRTLRLRTIDDSGILAKLSLLRTSRECINRQGSLYHGN